MIKLVSFISIVSLAGACGSDPEPAKDAASDATTTTSTTTATSGEDTTVADTTEPGETSDAADTGPDQTVCSAAGPVTLACVDESLLRATLDTIAGPRAPGDAKHVVAKDLCTSTLTDLGFTVTEIAAMNGDNTVGTNVIGTKLGATKAGELVIVGAHYDGVEACDAADDNGSGVAALLETARVLSAREHARTLVIACWDVEELGLIGSESHVDALVGADADVAMAYVFETMGYTSSEPDSQTFPNGFELLFPDADAALAARDGRGDFIAIISGDDAPGPNAAMVAAAEAIALPAIPVVLNEAFRGSPALGDLRRSDHASFWAEDYPGAMITDTANFRNPNYHCYDGTADTIETLDFDFIRKVAAMVAIAAEHTLDDADRGTTPAR